MGRPRMASKRMPYTESYSGEPDLKETPGETTSEMVWYGEERPVQSMFSINMVTDRDQWRRIVEAARDLNDPY